MHIRIAETRKQPGVCYAVTDDGIELPVIDLTHPSFDPAPLEPQVGAMIDAFIAESRRMQRMPAFLRALVLRWVLRKSVLARSLERAGGSFLPGVSTYLFKLGPENLGPYAVPIDRKIAAALPSVSIRLRMLDVARLLSEGIQPALAARPGRPLRLINIGGGPSIDSLNALIFLHRRGALGGRRAQVLTLDLEPEGASFGARALAALVAPGAPLHGVDATLQRMPYDWRQAEQLRELLRWPSEDAVGISSEGALFEYAADGDIEANLVALREGTPADAVVAGTATSDGEVSMILQRSNRVPLRPRSTAALEALVRRAGWKVARLVERPASRDFQLVKA